VEHAFRHHGVAMDALEGLESFFLNLTGINDTLSNGSRRFSWLHL
jgi:hypothetical protein